MALYVGDIGDAHPPLDPAIPRPMHGVALAGMGLPLVAAANLDELAATCSRLRRHSFLFTAAPPRILGLTGVPVNPLAIF